VVDRAVTIVGAGLAGSECAWQLARRGHRVRLFEMRPKVKTAAHQTGRCAELVCSNSFRSDDADQNAVGLLHEEMRRAGSLIMACADAHKLPAGGALAVDRDGFSDAVTAALEAEALISICREEVGGLRHAEWDSVIIATGPLTSPALSEAIRALTGDDGLAFFDAIAPIVYRDSIDFGTCWFQPATTRRVPRAPARTTSTARSTRSRMRHSSPPCWRAAIPSSFRSRRVLFLAQRAAGVRVEGRELLLRPVRNGSRNLFLRQVAALIRVDLTELHRCGTGRCRERKGADGCKCKR
jgi:hypothetical protein